MPTSIVALRGSQITLRRLGLAVLAFAVMAWLAAEGHAVILTPSVASPQKLGTPVTWTATIQHPAAHHTYGYQFSRNFQRPEAARQDFSPAKTFTWVPHTVEGAYQFSVVARDTTTTPHHP